MKYYNLYYKDFKINNRPITEEELKSVKESKTIYKRNNVTQKLESIPVKEIHIRKTIIV